MRVRQPARHQPERASANAKRAEQMLKELGLGGFRCTVLSLSVHYWACV